MGNYIDPNVTALGMTISNQAAKAIQEYLKTPSLNGIPIYTYEYLEIADADVSEQMIIDSSGGVLAYSDNVALKPKEWNLKGYIKGSPIEFTSLFMPSLQVQKYALMTFRSLRIPLTYKDPNQQTYQVIIERLEWPQAPDTGNALMININFKEINILTSILNQTDMATQSPATNAASSASSLGSSTPSINLIDIGLSTGIQATNYVNEYAKEFIPAYNGVDKKGNAIK